MNSFSLKKARGNKSQGFTHENKSIHLMHTMRSCARLAHQRNNDNISISNATLCSVCQGIILFQYFRLCTL